MPSFAWGKRIALIQVMLCVAILLGHRPPADVAWQACLVFAAIGLLPWIATILGERLTGARSGTGFFVSAVDVIAVAPIQVGLPIALVFAFSPSPAELTLQAWLLVVSLGLIPWLATVLCRLPTGRGTAAGYVFTALDVLAVASFAWATFVALTSGPNQMDGLIVFVVAVAQAVVFALLLVGIGLARWLSVVR